VHHVELADTPAESERIELGRPDRTPELLAICKRAEGINRHGYEMAQRGAIFSARQDYMQSLQTVAEALDAQRATHSHQRMLAAAFRALDEADDFAAIDIRAGAQINISSIAASHQTPIVKEDSHDDWSAQAAMGRYLTYAQEQLAGAVGDIPQASAALFGLGKVYSVPAAAHGPKDLTGGAKAVAFYQAALMVDRRNFMAANELGVALVQFGRLPEARAAFLHSLSLSSQPVVWQNLASIHQIMGENKLAEQARQSATAAANQAGKGAPALTTFDVQWVDPATFVHSAPLEADPIKATPTAAQQPAQPQPQHKSIADVLPWSSSSRRQ
jgi:tetratricopeptide (TPR) repeat protein